MDKTTYETYEYLPANSTTPDENEYFVVQDDGTYLINRQVQYVTQMQEPKRTLDPATCTVYDVTPQFFVDVTNSSELMSVSDEFVLPVGSQNLYANSYLLQPGSSTATDQMEEVIEGSQYKSLTSQPDSVNNEISTDKPVSSYTEITLNDEQYHMLERKGWLLLEIGDKVFVLDTLGGLRDVTGNDKLIQKLKSEDVTDRLDNKPEFVKTEDGLPTFVNSTSNLASDTNAIQFVIGNDVSQNSENIEELPFLINSKENISQPQLHQESVPTINPIKTGSIVTESQTDQNSEAANVKVYVVESDANEQNQKASSILRIKSKLSFKNIPNRIVLGKTVNGKLLVAKVKNTSKNNNSNENIVETTDVKPVAVDNMKNNEESLLNTSQQSITRLEDVKFSELFLQALQNNPEKKIDVKDLEAIELIISPLVQVPGFETGILNSNLFVTKIVQTEDNVGKSANRDKPLILTGRVKLVNNQWRFIHVPDMLHTMMSQSENTNSNGTEDADSGSVLHIQVTEIVGPGCDSVKTSIVLSKQNLPINFDVKKTSTVYACSACAALFKSEQELKEHHESQCMDTSDLFTMDIDKMKNTGIQCINLGKDKLYECTQCNTKFNKLRLCKNHIKTHFNPSAIDKKSNGVDKTTAKKNSNGVYKCKMCPCTYYHPSTLSKHIVTRHIVQS